MLKPLSAASSGKQITLYVSGSQQQGATMYTVPAGKTFKGKIGHTDASGYLTIVSSTGQVEFFNPLKTSSTTAWLADVELVGGTIVKSYGSTSGSSHIIGIES